MPSFTSAGLNSSGQTTHYQVQYDTTLDSTVGETTGNALLAGLETDFDLMNGWFGGIGSPWSGRMTVQIAAGFTSSGGIGASWPNLSGPITLTPGLAAGDSTASVSQWLVRYLLVSEVVEMFMDHQGFGWYGGTWTSGGNEGSAGEGLSRFLGTQFLLLNGQPLSLVMPGFNIAFTWLQTSARADFVNHVDGTQNGFVPQVGCAIVFIYYLFHQLGFTIDQICGAGADELSGVYANLTGDTSDPFPYFKALVDQAFPGTTTTTTGNLDDPWPIGTLSFYGVKDTWGKDEVTDIVDSGGRYPTAFWLALDGFNRQVVGSTAPNTPDIDFAGVTAQPGALGTRYQTSNAFVPQRILFPYDALFTAATEGAFPSSGETPAAVSSSMSVLGDALSADTEFFFTAGQDPYFTNVNGGPDPTQQNVPWLSQDLRVFTATPGLNQFPVSGGPRFSDDSFTGAYSFIQALITHLNTHYGDPTGTDPFAVGASILPGQSGALTGDSSVTPTTNLVLEQFTNYNFAVARVRLRGLTHDIAHSVKVFFRLWGTQTADTDWDPSYTYLSQDDSSGNPLYPTAPSDSHTIPFFATSNAPNLSDASNPEYGTHGVNNQDITIEQNDAQWAYFGCFLNLYDSTFVVNGQQVQNLLAGTHHCLVAQIAYSGAPIQSVGGFTPSPENSDKLAQRNLQVTTSDNPGDLATHIVPQTFDTRASKPLPVTSPVPPDELMIDWGTVPAGRPATIYWPGVDAAQVVELSSGLYGIQALSVLEPHTLGLETTDGVSYVPIPPGTGEGFAGLLTVELPPTVVKGQEFNATVRRLGTKRIRVTAPPPPPPPIQIAEQTGAGDGASDGLHVISSHPAAGAATAAAPEASGGAPDIEASASKGETLLERFVIGSWQLKVPVSTKHAMLAAEESTLAILKARLAALSPENRWYPVLKAYIGLIAARVDGLGGNAAGIPPSYRGYPPQRGGHGGGRAGEGLHRFTGRVVEVAFDCFGDLEGFVLRSCGEEQALRAEPSLTHLLLEVCRDRAPVAVLVKDRRVRQLIVLGG